MIKPAIVFVTAAMFAANGWGAENARAAKYESIGISGGAAIGGVASGPIGIVLGATLGALLGERFDQKHIARVEADNARVEAEQRWAETEVEVDRLNGLVTTRDRQVANLEIELQETLEMHATVSDTLDVQVLFRTNESLLPEGTQARLQRLAGLLARLDGTLIRIEGHADSRGNQGDNEQLSAQRAAAVRDTLIQAGVPVGRITIAAHGERYALAAENDIDALAMERRVDLTLIRNGEGNRIAQK